MEITDEKIFKIALFTSLIGLVGMIIFSSYVEVKEVSIGDIDRSMIDEKVSITGIIDSIETSSSGKSVFISLNDGKNKISIMIFESVLAEFEDAGVDLNSYLNHKVKIYGTVTEYKSTMEIILDNSNSIKLDA
ncbi:OB-fold nucleic acid binding domain-containing protein [Methanobrevibacter curvatus]|uniref:OB-fold nucleic acid binding domain protein n=1 Tax=Methanobrevibacter curvatus TaxID=49547 RepID=A0A166CEW2_9EURY|nr:OB-fold nucleic acid binding domain-containing protein [Methanobrevibacter curvatus]KZX14428.1 OB-fold nucleic acid binding domain protein [Methanobrevibacter curvatus]